MNKLKGNVPGLNRLEAICENMKSNFFSVNFFAEGEMLLLSIHAINYFFTERV